MKVELTSNMGWKPGKRALKKGEQPMVILYVSGKPPIVVATGGLSTNVMETLIAAGAEKI